MINSNRLERELGRIEDEIDRLTDRKREIENSLSPMLPSDTEAPMFAYGLFRSNQIGILRLHSFIEKIQPDIKLKGIIHERDGLPILEYDENRGIKVNGDLIYFKRDSGRFAYESISEIEPKNQYKWERKDLPVGDGSVSANLLVGKKPTTGSKEMDDPWDTWSDPLFVCGMQIVEDYIKNQPLDGAGRLFHLQMGYLLLWSIIERYVSLRWGLLGPIRPKLMKLADHDIFQKTLQRVVKGTHEVVDSRNPYNKEVLKPSDSRKSMNYYYQVRSNSAHRGKSINGDMYLLESSIKELFEIFNDVIKFDKGEAERLSRYLIQNGLS